ncbi:helix-turn-helix transcriptional regulator [Jeotgalibacillus aurantiacus]|uniref:helix-turn-helix transcriptional regulator n=1 Tax=Jeotgalibacillus aurantiacus TaxID=2763266 RepID=UPI001D0AA6E0|nr:helix-turn-helix domain-containing protein [Jeotgalibacillus aurantiacus]
MILREKSGFSKSHMAKVLGITLKTYTLKERGEYEFTQDEMFTLATFFDKKIDQIFLPRSHQNGDVSNLNKEGVN